MARSVARVAEVGDLGIHEALADVEGGRGVVAPVRVASPHLLS